MIYIPIIGAVALASGTIAEKFILRKRKLDYKLFQTASFFALILVMLPFIYFFWKVDASALEMKNILIFFLVIIFSLVANLFSLYSLKWEKITNLEPAKLVEPLFVILLAIIFSFFIDSGLYDRNLNVIIPALIAATALILSHIKKHHLEFNKYFITAIVGSFFFALELVTSRIILDFYSPISFYFIRCTFVFLFSFIIFRPDFSKLDTKIKWEIFVVGIIWVIYRVIVYYGYIHLGVIFTTLVIMISTIFIYVLAWKFLKEKVDCRNILAAIVILGSVLYVLLA